ncbi:hypothetical protein AVEN_116938-1, partial [Araneus ventricosus]
NSNHPNHALPPDWQGSPLGQILQRQVMWGGLKENQEFHKTATRCDHAHGDKSSKKLREPNGSRDEQRLGRERKKN